MNHRVGIIEEGGILKQLGGIWDASGKLQGAPRDSRRLVNSRRLQANKIDARLS